MNLTEELKSVAAQLQLAAPASRTGRERVARLMERAANELELAAAAVTLLEENQRKLGVAVDTLSHQAESAFREVHMERAFRTMESAPQDGSQVLLLFTTLTHRTVSIGRDQGEVVGGQYVRSWAGAHPALALGGPIGWRPLPGQLLLESEAREALNKMLGEE